MTTTQDTDRPSPTDRPRRPRHRTRSRRWLAIAVIRGITSGIVRAAAEIIYRHL